VEICESARLLRVSIELQIWVTARIAGAARMKKTLSPQFEAALVYAARIHGGQRRKKTGIPYIAHLLGVTALVLEHGGSEIEAIAALLHDAVEDAGGARRLADIRKKFGEPVAGMIDACTDSAEIPRKPWRERKELYLERITHATASVRLILAADKLHNARALLRSYRSVGEPMWQRYGGGKEGTLWYYRALANVLETAGPAPLADELDHVVSEIERMAQREV
jgi:(p)ppGpp synthase/HD superfamily hydrolase